MSGETVNLLICTVGGTPEPLVESLCHWHPSRVLFVPSTQTAGQIDAVLRCYAERTERPLSPGAYESFLVHDAESLDDCLEVVRRFDEDVAKWLSRGTDYRVVVDFTAGTKCMTAALVLQARRWRCAFSYVGGAQRSKGGVGIVEYGSRVVHSANPWDALGYQAVEDFVVLFNQRAFRAAANAANAAKRQLGRADRKREFNALEQLALAFDAWDRFDHQTAKSSLDNVQRAPNNLRQALGREETERVLGEIQRCTNQINTLLDASQAGRHHIADLLANARRRREEGRFDDGAARLYRAIEAIAQLALAERHGISATDDIALENIPESLRELWTPRAINGKLNLGLQDAYALLSELGDQVGRTFMEIGLHDPQRSPLTARNHSILAHGFEPVGGRIFDKLLNAAMKLGEFAEGDLPTFPQLANSWAS